MRKISLLALLGVVVAAPAQAAFIDISSSVYADAILYVQSEGIVEGYSDGSYKPDASINRAEFTKIIVESRHTDAEINGCSTATIQLSDVPADAWFAKYVCAAKSKGVISGYPDGTFKPAATINYAEAAKILVEAYGMTPAAEGSAWYEQYTQAIMAADADIGLKPASNLTRGQMAQLIYNLDMHMEGHMMDDDMDDDDMNNDMTGVEVDGVMMVESKTIVENAMAADSVSTLVVAVKAAELAETLSGPGPFTVFAPTNDAFSALPAGTLDTLLMTENQADLAGILTYHVVAGAYTSADLSDGMMLETVGGGTIEITYDGTDWYVNDAKILIADVKSSNGVTFVIDSVLLPEDDMSDSMDDMSGSYVDYSADLIANGEMQLLFFHATWCPTCQAADAELTSWYADNNFKVNTVKVDYDTQTDLKVKYGVTSQHTYVLIDGEGNLVTKVTGPDDAKLQMLMNGEV